MTNIDILLITDKLSLIDNMSVILSSVQEFTVMSAALFESRSLSLCLLIAFISLLNACAEARVELAPAASAPAVTVRAAPVQLRNNAEVLRFASVARARQRANLTFQVGGVIASRQVEIGQSVSTNQVLAELYNPQLTPARDAARARAEQLQSDSRQALRDLERIAQLHERGVVPIQDLEQQRSRVEGLESAIANALATLDQTERMNRESSLRAPFGGNIEAVLFEPGEFVQPGQAVMRLAAGEGLEVQVQVPAHLLAGLSVGDTVPVWSSLTDIQLSGVVSEIAQGSSGNNALYPVIVSLPPIDLRSGDALEVGIQRQRQPELTIPMTAIMRTAGGLMVFQLTGDRVRRVPVNVLQLQGEYALIEPGLLSASDSVIYAGLTRLADGDRVEVLP
jgi:RND family efflux transporter MFP subunit